MSDFAPNFTPRLRIRYTSLGKTHSQIWRVVRGVTDPSGLVGKVHSYLNAMVPALWSDFTILGADWALEDSDVFLPVTPPAAVTGANDASGAHTTDAAFAFSFVGRSSAGAKHRVFQYGTTGAGAFGSVLANDFRLNVAESAPIAAAVTALNELSPAVAANDGFGVTWYPYANMKYNDNWVKRLRRG